MPDALVHKGRSGALIAGEDVGAISKNVDEVRKHIGKSKKER